MRQFWNSLPQELQEPLCIGATGNLHLFSIARIILEGQPRRSGKLLPLAGDVMLAAWENAPFDRACARNALDFNQSLNFLPKDVSSCLNAVAVPARGDAALVRHLRNRLAHEDFDRIKILLRDAPKADGFSPDLCHILYELAWRGNEAPWVLERLPHIEPLFPQGLSALFRGDLLHLAGAHAVAAQAYEQSLESLPLPHVAARLASCLLELGERVRAAAILRRVVRIRPWLTSAILTLYDLEHNISVASPCPEGAGALVFYTWNKAESLDETLACLAGSNLGNARVVLLDNGSQDRTPDVLRKWAQHFGERCEIITLPVNIGAPAARNWLLATDSVRNSDWVAYLDDDISLPRHWLRAFAQAMGQYPDASVYGCAVKDLGGARLQSADLHYRPTYSAPQGQTAAPEASDLHLQSPDLGQFRYLRPCLSVTGCCHVFRTRTLLEANGFDIRFSPSQFDDFDCDLRLALRGGYAIYQGHCVVEHQRRTGKGLKRNAAASANAKANKDKLDAKYSPREREFLHATSLERTRQDLLRKIQEISDTAGEESPLNLVSAVANVR